MTHHELINFMLACDMRVKSSRKNEILYNALHIFAGHEWMIWT